MSGTGTSRGRRRGPARRGLALAVAVVALLVSLAAAWAGKAVCIDGRDGFWAFTWYCYSDVTELWDRRDLDRDAFPYRRPAAVSDAHGPAIAPFEYPPGTGLPVWVIALATDSRGGFFHLTAATLAAGALVTLGLLHAGLGRRGRPPWRPLGFALSPTLVVVGMQNWDLWTLPLAAGAVVAGDRRRPVLAGALVGLGAAVKWWPALLLIPLLAGPWAGSRAEDDRGRADGPMGALLREARSRSAPALAAAAAWLVVQLPALLTSPRAWWGSSAFHLRRAPNRDSTVAAIERLAETIGWGAPDGLTTAVTLGALLVGAGAIALGLERRRLAPADAALALVVVFLLTSKVLSPQFVLWLLPLAVLARVRWLPVLAVEAANLLVWFAMALYLGNGVPGMVTAAQVLSVVRTVLLAWLLVETVRPPRPAHAPSAPRWRAGVGWTGDGG